MKRSKTINRFISLILAIVIAMTSVTVVDNGAHTTAYAASAKVDHTIYLKKVADADANMAKKIDKYLTNGETVVLKVKTTKKKSADKIIKALKKNVQKVNTLGVVFTTRTTQEREGKYWDCKKSGKYLCYYILKDQCKAYKYAKKFTNLMWEDAKKAAASEDYRNHSAKFYWTFLEEWTSGMTLDQFCQTTEYNVSEGKKKAWNDFIEPANKVFSHQYFCDLSQAQQLWVVSNSSFFVGAKKRPKLTDKNGKSYEVYMMTYGSDGTSDYESRSLAVTITEEYRYIYYEIIGMYKNGLSGHCTNFAEIVSTYMMMLGIDSYRIDSIKLNHAFNKILVKNSKGKLLEVMFDYGIICEESSYDKRAEDGEGEIFLNQITNGIFSNQKPEDAWFNDMAYSYLDFN